MSKVSSILHRDDPDKPPLGGHVKVTREDWLNVARDILISEGVGQVKVLGIAERLDVSRSSFYWYFKSRKDLLNQLLDDWDKTNTGIMVRHTEIPAETITGALNNFFRCVVDPEGFNHQLDFAVREWARRDGSVRRVIDRADTVRHAAIAKMFERHGYEANEADIRARVLYYQQLGYYALDLAETVEERLTRVAGYLYCFSGVPPLDEEVAEFTEFTRKVTAG
ncbi:TetR/AcrR family transcriptional regulator [Lentibacter sp. XHP0401]|jgi:AcrR family transcriptional regulator|uniref:TetR/AcrR family transcriptional regulator n=1 Tax=Lentibacter sp. XHP0401 TaxID=2984334 RepID=UPI0021E974DA|nr:TetR/AcrR family transcriptional regulator [Lentibacter sp. XHP0401]MCV2894687.1 TetR/AcrR family transcriptional regulator [Lentibacter sp. XHP0401]